MFRAGGASASLGMNGRLTRVAKGLLRLLPVLLALALLASTLDIQVVGASGDRIMRRCRQGHRGV